MKNIPSVWMIRNGQTNTWGLCRWGTRDKSIGDEEVKSFGVFAFDVSLEFCQPYGQRLEQVIDSDCSSSLSSETKLVTLSLNSRIRCGGGQKKADKGVNETHLPCSFSCLTRQTSSSVKFKDSAHGGLVLQGGYDGNGFR